MLLGKSANLFLIRVLLLVTNVINNSLLSKKVQAFIRKSGEWKECRESRGFKLALETWEKVCH